MAGEPRFIIGLAEIRKDRLHVLADMLAHGLNIVEPVEAPGPAAECAKVVNLASWSDDSRSGLELHEPAATDIVVMLGSRH